MDKRARPLAPDRCWPASPLAAGSSRRRPDLGSRQPVSLLQGSRSFALHEPLQRGARRCVRAAAGGHHLAHRARAQRSRLQGRLAPTPDRCAATAGKRYQQSRLGWAAQTLGETCYESNARPRRYASICARKYSWERRRKTTSCRRAHTVVVRIAPEQLAGVSGDCFWAWQPRKAGGKGDAARTVRGQAHHRARALRVRSQQFRRLGHRQAARRPRACRRARGGGRGPLHRRAR